MFCSVVYRNVRPEVMVKIRCCSRVVCFLQILSMTRETARGTAFELYPSQRATMAARSPADVASEVWLSAFELSRHGLATDRKKDSGELERGSEHLNVPIGLHWASDHVDSARIRNDKAAVAHAGDGTLSNFK